MQRLIFALALIGSLGYGAQAVAQTGGAGAPPVTINSCGPILDKNSQQTVFGIPVTSSSSGIAIEFVNTAPKTATVVNFAVVSNDENFVIRDVGSFAPGVSIVHQYRKGAGQSFVLPSLIGSRITCRVASIKFADGSAWPHGQPSNTSTLSASPARIALDATGDAELFLITDTSGVAAFRETDDCANVAQIAVGATGQTSAAYTVKPLAAGSCTATITDDNGRSVSVPIVVR